MADWARSYESRPQTLGPGGLWRGLESRCAAPTSSPNIWSRSACPISSATPATARSGCSTGSTRSDRPHPTHLAAHRADGRLHGRRLLSPDRPAARRLRLDRPGTDEPDDLGRQRLLRQLGVLRHHRQRADQPDRTPARCRTTIAITATCRRCSRPIVKKSWRIRKVEDLVKALPDAFSMMRTGRPGPVHFDMPYDLYMRTAPVTTPDPAAHGAAAELAHDGRRRDGRAGAEPADRARSGR